MDNPADSGGIENLTRNENYSKLKILEKPWAFKIKQQENESCKNLPNWIAEKLVQKRKEDQLLWSATNAASSDNWTAHKPNPFSKK